MIVLPSEILLRIRRWPGKIVVSNERPNPG